MGRAKIMARMPARTSQQPKERARLKEDNNAQSSASAGNRLLFVDGYLDLRDPKPQIVSEQRR